jgi:hypothetical protein
MERAPIHWGTRMERAPIRWGTRMERAANLPWGTRRAPR